MNISFNVVKKITIKRKIQKTTLLDETTLGDATKFVRRYIRKYFFHKKSHLEPVEIENAEKPKKTVVIMSVTDRCAYPVTLLVEKVYDRS